MFKGSGEKVKISMKVKKKKDKPKKFVGKGLKIVDEDSFSHAYKPASDSDDGDVEDLPQIAGVVDERPVEVQLLESFSQSKWKRLEDEGDKDLLSKGLPSRRHSDDISPPRQKNRSNSEDSSPLRQRSRSRRDSGDISPPRQRSRSRRDSGDISPPRQRSRRNSGDISPPRQRSRRNSGDISPPRQRSRRDSGDISPPRRRSRRVSGDISPPRQRSRRDSADISPRRQKSRNTSRDGNGRKYSDDTSNSRNKKGERISPHRKFQSSIKSQTKGGVSHASLTGRQRRSSSDTSPPRRRNKTPPRVSDGRRNDRDRNLARPEILDASDQDKKMQTTLDGKKAGLQKAAALRDEMLDFSKRENEIFEMLPDAVSGRNAKAVKRDRRTEADIVKEQEKQRKEEERKQQYNKWGKGLKQVEEQESRVRSALHEIAKPLARYKDDEDLDDHLKQIDREGDPMLEYLSAKRRKATGGVEKPKYAGPQPPPNRFSIPPGYRWDGVDRSNGYEKEWFSRINAKKAVQDEAYKWSVEDL